MQEIQIGQFIIGAGHVPFIIAELSGNHHQSIEIAKELIAEAAKAGVHAIKLQTYTPDTLTLNVHKDEFVVHGGLWDGESLHSLYQKAMTPWEWHQELFDYAKSLGMVAFSTPFDLTAVEFLESLDVPCHKIASFENIDHQLLRAVAATGKPVIMSTGMATQAELDESVAVLREAGCKELILLKCTSSYPADPVYANLKTIPDFAERYQCHVGLSDHTLGLATPITAVALGASVIEKHFVMDRNAGGVDAAFSLEPAEFEQLVIETARAKMALGQVFYGPTEQEVGAVAFRRSLYIAKDVKAGELLTAENVRSVRPGLGLAPKHLPEVLGKVAKQDLVMGTALNWDIIDDR